MFYVLNLVICFTGFAHVAAKDDEYHGYHIPAGTMIMGKRMVGHRKLHSLKW